MADSNHTPPVEHRRRLLPGIILCALALAVALVWSAPAARADGDPASDVLATQQLFLPADAAIPTVQLGQLGALQQEAARSGEQIRVALIASPTDLGSITELWKQPADYAKFLGQELSLTYRGLLLVIMPNGFGLYHQGQAVSMYQAALARVPIHAAGAGLASTVLTAIQRLAAAGGHTLALPHAQAPSSNAPGDPTPWIVFGAGLVLVALAWTASLRARPLRRGQPRSA